MSEALSLVCTDESTFLTYDGLDSGRVGEREGRREKGGERKREREGGREPKGR